MVLFYPFSIATVAAGILAFIMILLNMDMLLVGTVVLWFYFISTVSIYAISKEALERLGVHRYFLCFLITIGILAILSSIVLWQELASAV